MANVRLFEIRESPIHGRGVFATCRIPEGGLVGIALRRTARAGDPDASLRQTLLARYLNHSPKPNTAFAPIRGGFALIALRDIGDGEELLVDYPACAEAVEPEPLPPQEEADPEIGHADLPPSGCRGFSEPPLSSRAAARKVKAISVRQPWANMIADGRKTIETRKWSTRYRGPLLIVSTAKPAIEPAGCALAFADLVDCRPMTKADERAAGCPPYPSAQAWVLDNIRRIDPFPVRGSLGLYEVDLPERFAAVASEPPLSKRARALGGERRRMVRWIRDNVTDPENHCFFYAAALAALFPGLTLVRGRHSQQRPEDTAHFWTEDEDGNIVDPTAAQYHGGEYSGGVPVSLEANLEEVTKDPLFRKLPNEDQEKILAASAMPLSGRFVGFRRYTALPLSRRAARHEPPMSSWERHREPLWFMPPQKKPPPGFQPELSYPGDPSEGGFRWADAGTEKTPGVFVLGQPLARWLFGEINSRGWTVPGLVLDADKGIFPSLLDPRGRQVRIGKFLSMLRKKLPSGSRDAALAGEALRQYEVQPKETEWRLVVSAEPADLRGISTGKGWGSCMALKPGERKECLESSIGARDMVAYAVGKDGQWLARSVLRFDGKGRWWPEKAYGQPSSIPFDLFLLKVRQWLEARDLLGKEGEFSPFFQGPSDWRTEHRGPRRETITEETGESAEFPERYRGTGLALVPSAVAEWPRKVRVFIDDVIFELPGEFDKPQDVGRTLRDIGVWLENRKGPGRARFTGIDEENGTIMAELWDEHALRRLKSNPLVEKVVDERTSLALAALCPPISKRAARNPGECPLCGLPAQTRCRCRMAESACPNGHRWHSCPIHGTPVLGHGGVLGRCSCGLRRPSNPAKDHDYVAKKKEESGNFTYVYDEKHIAARNRKKEKRLKKLSKSLKEMRAKVKGDLASDDDSRRLAALAVALIDETYERVGNEESASELKHYGVTGWMVKHVSLGKGKATIKYVGKAGVKQSKEVKDKAVLKALRRACEGKAKGDRVLEGISAKDVNAYLTPFGITAKDIRGYHANKEMLRSLKRNGKPPKGDEKAIKERFKKALEDAAKKVGHEPGTLKRQYLIPRIEQYYMEGKSLRDILASRAVPLSKRATEQFLLFVGGFPIAWFPSEAEAEAQRARLVRGFPQGESILWDYVRMESHSPFALVSMVDPTVTMPNFDAMVELLRADPQHAAFLRRYAETVVSVHRSPEPIDSDRTPPGRMAADLYELAGDLPSPDMPGFDWDGLAKASDGMNGLIEGLAGKMAKASARPPLSRRAATPEEKELTFLYQLVAEALKEAGGYEALEYDWQRGMFDEVAEALWHKDLRHAAKLVDRILKYIVGEKPSKQSSWDDRPPLSKRARPANRMDGKTPGAPPG